MILNINTDAAVVFTAKLERLRRSALPNAVRSTLNSAAFDVKKDTLQKSAKKEFVNRSPNFFKAFSRVEMARGFNIESMKSTVGMQERSAKNSYAVKELEQQEEGGTIKKKSFIPLKSARGGNDNKLVRPNARLNQLKNIIDARKMKGKSDGEKFFKAMSQAKVGSVILADYKEKTILWRVNSLRKNKGSFKLTGLYSFEKSRSVKVSATEFMKKASLESGGKIEKFFIEHAKREILK